VDIYRRSLHAKSSEGKRHVYEGISFFFLIMDIHIYTSGKAHLSMLYHQTHKRFACFRREIVGIRVNR
jgi:hypothetical protein